MTRPALILLGLALMGHATANPQLPKLAIEGEAGMIIEAISGRVLWQKNPHKRMHPASTTKIVTAMVALESLELDDTLVSPADAKAVGGSTLHLKKGEKLSVEDALYATMLRSANDVCHAFAVQIAGSDAAFAKQMNLWAAEQGALNSNFCNPHGLSEKEHLTTASDLALMAQAAMENEVFAAIVRTPKRTIARSMNEKDTVLLSRNEYLNLDPTADGIKTGYTEAAGRCFVGSATRNGFRVITVVLKSKDAFADHRAMLDWTYQNYRLERTTSPTVALLDVPVAQGEQRSVRARPTVAVPLLARTGAEQSVEILWRSDIPVTAPVTAGQPLGEAIVRDSDYTVFRVPIVAAEGVTKKESVLRDLANRPAGANLSFLLGGLMLLGAVAFRRKSRRI